MKKWTNLNTILPSSIKLVSKVNEKDVLQVDEDGSAEYSQ